MSAQTPSRLIPSTLLPPIIDLPFNGYGGSYYDVQFSIPVYSDGAEDVYQTMSWHDVDDFYHLNVSNAIERAVSFGICIATLLNLIVLTPQHKRRLPLHSCMCFALVFQIIRNATDMVLLTKGPFVASYAFLTADLTACNISQWPYGVTALGAVASCLAFVSLQACFFIQSRALMTWVRLRYNLTFHALLGVLVLAGVVALGFRIGLAVIQIEYFYTPFEPRLYEILEHGTVVAYAVSIGAWSLVFLISSVSILVSRRRTLLRGNSIYNKALNLVAILGLESFIIPVVFCILQVFPVSFIMLRPEVLVIPSVLFLLPIGTLFTTVHGNSVIRETQPTRAKGDPIRHLKGKATEQGETSHQVPTSGSAARCTNHVWPASQGSRLPIVTAQEPKRVADLFEMELAFIDDLDRQGSNRLSGSDAGSGSGTIRS